MTDIDSIRVTMTPDELHSILFEDYDLCQLLQGWGRTFGMNKVTAILEDEITKSVFRRLSDWRDRKVNEAVKAQEKAEKAKARKQELSRKRKEAYAARKKAELEYIEKSKRNPLNFTGRRVIRLRKDDHEDLLQ